MKVGDVILSDGTSKVLQFGSGERRIFFCTFRRKKRMVWQLIGVV